MTSLLTTTLEEMKKENNGLKADNTQLRTSNDAMKDEITQLKAKQEDEIGQLTTLLDKTAASNESQLQQIAQLKIEVQQLKVSHDQ